MAYYIMECYPPVIKRGRPLDYRRVSLQAFEPIHMKLNWFRGRFKVEGPIFRGKSMASGIGFPKKSHVFFQEPLFLGRRRLVYGRRCEAEEKYLKVSWGPMEVSKVKGYPKSSELDHVSIENLGIPNLKIPPYGLYIYML